MGSQSKHTRWKMTKGEKFSHKLTKPSTFRKFNKVEQGCILGIILIAGFFVVSYGYYQNVYLPSIPPTSPNAGSDPYNPIWNGTIKSTSLGTTFVQTITHANVGTGNTISLTRSKGDFLGVSITQNFAGSCSNFGGFSISDNLGNTWTQVTAFNNYANNAWYSLTTNAGSEIVTLGTVSGSCTGNSWSVDQYSSVSTVGNIVQTFVNSGSTVSSNSLTLTISSSYSIVWEPILLTDNSCHTLTASPQTQRTNMGCQANNNPFSTFDQLYVGQNGNSKTQTVSFGTCNPSLFCKFAHAVVELRGTPPACPAGYQCLNSKAVSNDIQLNANSTFAGEMLTNSTVDLSLLASKQALFYENWSNSSIATQPFGWYLTTNSTLPLTPSYSPLYDQSVTMAVVAYPTTQNAYLFIQRTPGQQLLPTAGVGPDSFPNCPSNTVLYLCLHFNNLGGGFKALMTVFNFTGPQAGVQGSGLSYLCYNTPFTSNLFTYGSAVLNQNYCANTNTLPWLNVNSQYYVGFWSGAGQQGSITFGSTTGSATFAENANAIFYWVPNPAATNTPTDSGGFFGFIGRAVSGVFSQIGGALSGVYNGVAGFGNSLLSVMISGFSQAISVVLLGYKIVLNFIGNTLGLGNIGDLFVATLISIGNLIVKGFSAIVGFFTAIGSIINSGYFNFLSGAAVLVATLLPVAIALWNIIFNAAFTVNDLLFIDYCIGMIMVAAATRRGRGSLKAFMSWVALNKFIFLFVFNLAWVIFDVVTRPIHRTKETVDPL